jgi:transglutaminase-like putative cysteine protease
MSDRSDQNPPPGSETSGDSSPSVSRLAGRVLTGRRRSGSRSQSSDRTAKSDTSTALSGGDRGLDRSLSTGSLHGLTLAAAVLCAVIFIMTEGAIRYQQSRAVVESLITAGVALAAMSVVRRRVRSNKELDASVPFLVGLTLLSLLWEPFQRSVFETGRSFEMMIMFSQKNLLLGLAVFGLRYSYQRLSILLGVCMVIFCSVVSTDRTVAVYAGIYGGIAVTWLIASHWETLRVRMLPSQHSRMPKLWLPLLVILPLLVLVLAPSAGTRLITAARGFLPGSGGQGDSDPFARDGVNDGDALVAGKDNIQTFGPIDDAPFADDKRPSLYDVVNDQLDEPVRPPKQQDRSVSLPPQMMAQIRQRMSTSQQANRNFSTHRRNKNANQRLRESEKNSALFYVAGRVPLHLRMEVYDLFDGVDWYAGSSAESDATGMQTSMQTIAERPWFCISASQGRHEIFRHSESHAVKIINFRSNVIPAPSDTRRVHIEHINDASMFSANDALILKMNRDRIPELVPIHVMSDRVDRDLLPDHPDLVWNAGKHTTELSLPEGLHMQQLRELAREWTKGLPRGWQQVDAVCQKLRQSYQVDRDYRSPEDCQFPVADFLLRSKRGPDYLFAGATAVLLRSLGYPTRLVSGFYAQPEKYEHQRGHTPVSAGDIHFWCEVSTGFGPWITVEPTPGFEVLDVPAGLLKRFQQAFFACLQWASSHSTSIAVLLLAGVVMLIQRQWIAERFFTAIWKFIPGRTARERILQTVNLLDRRFRYAGQPRPQSMTLNRWFLGNGGSARTGNLSIDRPSMDRFIRLADWAAFSRHERPCETSVDEISFRSDSEFRNDVDSLCGQVADSVTFSSCRPDRGPDSPDSASLKNAFVRPLSGIYRFTVSIRSLAQSSQR